ncbi:AMP-binding protein [Nonomuraea sp. ATR24]|uniref:AMP-binding protein n=1 Tax=Nonomuraea TaxID=83681 RepID=UPI001C5F0E37|nr:AMP-binding protein [Nonomuraea ceibae]
MLRHVEERPQADAVIFKGDGETRIGYLDLHLAAREVASWLQTVCKPGDRVLLCYPTGIEFVRALLACLYADVVPVPLPLPTHAAHHLSTQTGVALDADAHLVLTDTAHADAIHAWLTHDDLGTYACVATDGVTYEDPADWVEPMRSGDDAALLHYTSGLAGEPVGIPLSHTNLLHNVETLAEACGLRPGTRTGGWLPLHHGLGLFSMLLAPLLSGGTAVLLPPETFCVDPLAWLRLLDRHQVEVSAAPSFGYDQCLHEMTDEECSTLDLSRLRHLLVLEMTGLPPIEPDMLHDFAGRLRPAGLRADALRTAYCLPEATMIASIGAAGQALAAPGFDTRALDKGLLLPGADGPRLAGLGRPAGHELLIVDPFTGVPAAEGAVGEIWVRGPHVAAGYWRRDRLSAERFEQSTATGEKGFVRSGTLGATVDGRLHVTGTSRDLVLFQGRPLHLGRVERSLLDLGTLVACTAFPAPDSAEKIVVVAQPGGGRAGDGLVRAVRDRLALRFGLQRVGVVLVRPGQFPVTPDGGVNRQLVRELLRANALDVLDPTVAENR